MKEPGQEENKGKGKRTCPDQERYKKKKRMLHFLFSLLQNSISMQWSGDEETRKKRKGLRVCKKDFVWVREIVIIKILTSDYSSEMRRGWEIFATMFSNLLSS